MTDHTDLRDRIEDMLKDASNADWTTTELDNALRIALHELSVALPARSVTTIDAVADTWEYDLSAVTALVGVVEVWYPYLSTHQSYKQAHPIKWRMLDDDTLLLEIDDPPDATYDVRVFYDQLQTLTGLDGATATTLNAHEQSALIFGSAGYAAIALAMEKVEQTQGRSPAAEALRKWGWARVMEFRQRVNDLSDQEVAAESSVVGMWAVDKWDD